MLSRSVGTGCLTPFTYNATRGHCEKTPECSTGATYDSASKLCKMNPTCSSGGYNPTNNLCESNTSYAGTLNYSCPSGGTLIGSTCNIAGSYAATRFPLYNGYWTYYSFDLAASDSHPPKVAIPAGLTINLGASYYGCEGTGLGLTTIGQTYFNSTYWFLSFCGTWGYTCPSGGTLSGTTCNTNSPYGATSYHTCPSGGTLSGSTCNIYTTVSASCLVGTFDGNSDKCLSNPACTGSTLDNVLGVCWTN